MKLVKNLNRLPREVVDAPSMEINMARLDGAEQPDLVEHIPAHCRGAGLDDLGSFQPKLFHNSIKIFFSNKE